MAEFQVRRDNYMEYRTVATAPLPAQADLAPDTIVVRVSRFAFTANNITYAVAGDMLGYWQFFPPNGDDADGWGVIPVWGFAEVVRSTHPDVPVGERLFGYFPPADELLMAPGHVSAGVFTDTVAHRAKLPPFYNLYRRVGNEPGYDEAHDAERMLLWPLYATGFCLADALRESDWYGASQIVVLSASSKTSIGLGYALKDIPGSPRVIGLTSSGNAAFVKKLALYDEVASYEALESVDAGLSTVIVDMSGNSELLGSLHEQLGDNMTHTLNVGLTHWDQAAGSDRIISDRSEMFFVPSYMQNRIEDLGAKAFERQSSEFVRKAIGRSKSWLKLTSHKGLEGLAAIYPAVCAGRSAPDEGQIVEMY